MCCAVFYGDVCVVTATKTTDFNTFTLCLQLIWKYQILPDLDLTSAEMSYLYLNSLCNYDMIYICVCVCVCVCVCIYIYIYIYIYI